jgi:hypothetical protein
LSEFKSGTLVPAWHPLDFPQSVTFHVPDLTYCRLLTYSNCADCAERESAS